MWHWMPKIYSQNARLQQNFEAPIFTERLPLILPASTGVLQSPAQLISTAPV